MGPYVADPCVEGLKGSQISLSLLVYALHPRSLDALLVGHLIYYRLSPAAPPVLQQKVGGRGKEC